MNSIPVSATRPTTGIRIAQVVGLTSAAYLAGKAQLDAHFRSFVDHNPGAIGSISWQSVPALLDAPAPLLAKQWKKIFDQGKVVAPPMAAISSAIFGYLAYRGMFAHVS